MSTLQPLSGVIRTLSRHRRMAESDPKADIRFRMLLRRKTILWPAIPCCNLKIDIRLVLISGDAMRRRDFSVQVCQLINAPNSCSITSPAVASTGFDRHSPRNYAFGK